MTYSARLDGSAVEVEIGPEALRAGSVEFSYPDMDDLIVDGWTLTMRGPDRELKLEQLGRTRDDLLRELRAARLPARRAAMLQSGAAKPIDSFDAWRGDVPVLVGLHSDGITVEPDLGTPDYIPLSCLIAVDRSGYDITLRARAMEPVTVSKFGPRTDEFLQDLEEVRRELAKDTRDAYGALDASLVSLSASDGWAVTRADAGPLWESLRGAFAGQARAEQLAVLEQVSGEDLRLGIKTAFQGGTMPFALALSGKRIAVESADEEARATFVFETDDADYLNFVLLLTGFRREALFLPEEKLGRWSVAVRMLPAVRWARSALAERVVHDSSWETKLRSALA
ncbi:MAG: hypothetical protein ABR548_14095 [Actinomycetota bacterium]|nr:hypothetical protein [Actinomycetota bacterium]